MSSVMLAFYSIIIFHGQIYNLSVKMCLTSNFDYIVKKTIIFIKLNHIIGYIENLSNIGESSFRWKH